jgi:hypothetical protein
MCLTLQARPAQNRAKAPNWRLVMGKIPKLVVVGSLVCTVLAVTIGAQPMMPGAKKVAGETWRNSMSMEMQGMTMPMPGGGRETCVPVGRAQETLAAPDKDCKVYDTQASGNKFSAKFSCTGNQRMEGSMESVSDGDHIRGTMRARMPDGNQMTMKFDNTRLGKACEAIDYSGVKAPPVPVLAQVDLCKISNSSAMKDIYLNFIGPASAECKKSAHFKTFCALVKSPSGLLWLDMEQRKNATMDFSAYEKITDVSATKEPLTKSLATCGIDKSPTAVAALKRSLLATAEAEVNWDYLLIEGDAGSGGGGGGQGGGTGGRQGGGGGGGQGGVGGLGGMAGAAQTQCTGLGFTSTSSNNPKYAQVCRDYGYPLSRGDYDGARGNAYRKYGLDYASSGGSSGGVAASQSSAAGTRAGRTAGAPPAGAPTTGSAAAAAAENAQAPADPDSEPSEKDDSNAAIEKGKRVLRGIFGR